MYGIHKIKLRDAHRWKTDMYGTQKIKLGDAHPWMTHSQKKY